LKEENARVCHGLGGAFLPPRFGASLRLLLLLLLLPVYM
jgi:hypothetical protein